MSAEDTIKSAVEGNDVMLFMKGTPQFPQCGFSSQVVQILNYLEVPYHTVNVLESDEMRNGIKAFSNWPTIPSALRQGRVHGSAATSSARCSSRASWPRTMRQRTACR